MIFLLLAWLLALAVCTTAATVIAWEFHRSTRPRAEMIELAPAVLVTRHACRGAKYTARWTWRS